ncbi:hypothetical protein DPMN_001082 [Dreissena polymorpha]|uniref:Uncharacterized protein n=1 Tax=Dreissena polymorpha TaxID=45954 RepID=A0A9D4MH49_DREPO|nr:hypothetical protein DPMN_001082 [Dreissena polymorpha]
MCFVFKSKPCENKPVFTLSGYFLCRLFQKQSTSAVDLCVRCHPHVLPLDVLYMCRKYDVAMETIFKQYMNWMCQEATSSIK